MDTHNATEEIRIMSAFSKKFLPTLSYAISASLPNFSKSRVVYTNIAYIAIELNSYVSCSLWQDSWICRGSSKACQSARPRSGSHKTV